MAALVLIISGAIAVLLVFSIVVRVAQFLGAIAILILCAVCMAIGYVSLAVFGISLVTLHELLGGEHFGWALAGAGVIGFVTAAQMFDSAVKSIRTFPERVRNWRNSTAATTSTTRKTPVKSPERT